MARRTALVTGASGGIGEAFARRLAADHDVILVARNRDRLAALADELGHQHPDGAFTVHPADLARTTDVQALIDSIVADGVVVDLLVNNAGFGSHGSFAEADTDTLAGQVQLNCMAVVALTRALLPSMIERGGGGVINVASTAAFQPVPTMAVYGATKAFILSFSEAVHVETRGTGVDVLALCPGATQTGFFTASGQDYLTTGRETPDEVVTTAFRGLRRHRSVAVSGLLNRVSATGYRFLPRSLIARGSGYLVRQRRPSSPEQ